MARQRAGECLYQSSILTILVAKFNLYVIISFLNGFFLKKFFEAFVLPKPLAAAPIQLFARDLLYL